MPEVRIAGCKINLFLKIVGVRSDGYHLLDSLFWPLNKPHDTLTFEPKPRAHGLSISCNINDIDLKNNTLTRAYAAFSKATSINMGAHIDLMKSIPHGAGLGGGSSDAACLLQWCNEHTDNPLSDEQLKDIALSIGADVPFFLQNAAARVQGIGEVIVPVENFLKNKSVLLVCPNIYISTPAAYAAWDVAQKNIFSTQDLTKFAHKDKDSFSCVSNAVHEFKNDFESVIFAQHPELATIKDALIQDQAELAIMSGSGSTMVGVFTNESMASKAATSMEHKGYRVFISTL